MSSESSIIAEALAAYLQEPVMSISFKFKRDDIVIHKNTRARGKITSCSVDMNNINNYYVEYFDMWRGNMFEKEDDIELELPSYTSFSSPTQKCECGSDVTYGDIGVHADYCPKYRKG